jgi:MFS family permease
MLSLLAAYMFVQSLVAPMQPAILMSVTPAPFRGQMISLTTVAAVIFALTVGPTLVGVLNDFLFQGREDIRLSLMLVNFLFPALAILTLWRGRALYGLCLVGTDGEAGAAG